MKFGIKESVPCWMCGVEIGGLPIDEALSHMQSCAKRTADQVRDGRQVMNVLRAREPMVLRRFEDGMAS